MKKDKQMPFKDWVSFFEAPTKFIICIWLFNNVTCASLKNATDLQVCSLCLLSKCLLNLDGFIDSFESNSRQRTHNGCCRVSVPPSMNPNDKQKSSNFQCIFDFFLRILVTPVDEAMSSISFGFILSQRFISYFLNDQT